jgi:hypothetical protein
MDCSIVDQDGCIIELIGATPDLTRHIVHCVNNYDRLREALREVTATLAWVAHGECRAIQDDPIMPSAQAQEAARALLAELDNLEPKP